MDKEKKSGFRTLLISVLMSSYGPIILGLGLRVGHSSTQISDFTRRTAELLFEKYPGRWEIKYNILNGKAAELWNSVAAPFGPVKKRISNVEEVLSFTTWTPEGREA